MQGDFLLLGRLSAFPSGQRPLSPRAWTGVGAPAIPLWATWPALAVHASEMPAFQVLAIAFFVSWFVLRLVDPSAAETLASGRQGGVWLVPVLACALGLCGSNAFFILAIRHIPPA